MGNLERRFPRYSKLLRLYPSAYQAQYSEQMLQTLADMLDDPQVSRLSIWTRTALDFPLSMLYQQLNYAGGVMFHEMPNYVKRNALISAGLLLPFLLALSANGLDKVITNHDLYNSWLWSMPILAIWVLWLPAAAALVALISFVAFLVERRNETHTSLRAQLFDIRRSWPLLITGLVALFIVAAVFGHDSVHCVMGNPVRELHNWHQTWQCIEQRSPTPS